MLARTAQELQSVKQSIRILLDSLIDYAGLFPPAGLTMPDAVRNYDEYRRSEHAWALGRYIVPASRLEELDDAAADEEQSGFLQLSVLASDDIDADVRAIEGRHEIESIEMKAATKKEIDRAAKAIGGSWVTYVEVTDLTLLDTIRKRGMRAKLRTGGVTPDAIPTPEHVAEFVRACVDRKLGFKATAGLHHPIRSQRALTYEPDAPHWTMHGFINLLMATALPRFALEILNEADPAAFDFGHGGAAWRGERVVVEKLAALRRDLLTSFGSCSFVEPIDELKELEWL
jgi:hypothetical protein